MQSEELSFSAKVRNLEFKTALVNCENILLFWNIKYMDSDNPKIKHEFSVNESTNEMEVKFTISLNKEKGELDNDKE